MGTVQYTRRIQPNSIGESLGDFATRACLSTAVARPIWRDFADAFKARNVGKWEPYMPGGRTAQEAGRVENMRSVKAGG